MNENYEKEKKISTTGEEEAVVIEKNITNKTIPKKSRTVRKRGETTTTITNITCLFNPLDLSFRLFICFGITITLGICIK